MASSRADNIALFRHPHFDIVVNSTFPCVQKLDLEAMASYFTVMPQIDLTPCLSKINVPTCVIVGDRDPIVPPGQSSTIAEKIANSNLTIIKGSGHLPFLKSQWSTKEQLILGLQNFNLDLKTPRYIFPDFE